VSQSFRPRSEDGGRALANNIPPERSLRLFAPSGGRANQHQMANDHVDTAAALMSGEHLAANLTRPRATIWTFGPDGKCRMVNKRWLEYCGMTIEQERGDGWI